MISVMRKRAAGRGRDPVGVCLALFLLMLLGALLFFQAALARDEWRARHSPVDRLEGIPLRPGEH